jgi:small subunit ribosomal protein S16
MLKIRLQRVGRKNIPIFRVVLTDSRNSAKSGKFLEVLGSYDPTKHLSSLDNAKIKFWLEKGARPSETVNNFLVKQKIISGKKLNVLSNRNPKKKGEKKTEDGTKKEEAGAKTPEDVKKETQTAATELTAVPAAPAKTATAAGTAEK